MTLVLGIKCLDGIVIASDSQVTYSTSGQEVKGTGNKLHDLSRSIVWAGSGHVGLVQRVQLALASNDLGIYEKAKSFGDLRQKLHKAVVPAVKEVYSSFMTFGPSARPPLVGFLFAGYCAGKPFIYEISHDLTDTEHTPVGFAAIGSGDIYPYHAITMLGHYRITERKISEAQLISYRIVADAITTAAHGLGPPVQMVAIEKPGSEGGSATCRRLSEEEIRILGDKIIEWKRVESDALDEVVGIKPLPEKGSGASEAEREPTS